MIRKAFAALALSVISLSASAATYAFSYQGIGGFPDTKGHGTFVLTRAGLQMSQPVVSVSGVFNDVEDATFSPAPDPRTGAAPYVLRDMPFTGTVWAGAQDMPFSPDNLFGMSAGGLMVSQSGIVLRGERLPGAVAYIHIFQGTCSGITGYCVETYLAPFAGYPGVMFRAPVLFTVQAMNAGLPIMPRPGPIPAPMPSN